MNNKLIIAAAGAGKTTYLIKKALKIEKNENILITTYTIANENEIKKKIIELNGFIPSNIKIITWFSFLLKHGAKPYKGCFNGKLYDQDIKGVILVNKKSAQYKFKTQLEYYFNQDWKIYSDKLSDFVYECNKRSKGLVIKRLENIFDYIFIDEVQDLAGYDLEILKLLFNSKINTLLVGDPRQTVYLTHHENKFKKYKNGKIQEFIQNEVKNICEIDTETLNISHRNNQQICDFSSQLYPEYVKVNSCNCCIKKNVEHQGIFLIEKKYVDDYIKYYSPVKLRWDSRTKLDGIVYNFGESKGLTFDRVLIFPTKSIKKWLENQQDHLEKIQLKNDIEVKKIKNFKTTNNALLSETAKAKLYVAITRAKYSVAFVI